MERLKTLRVAECGLDFCEDCGDCLACYPDECFLNENGKHNLYQLYYNHDYDGELLDESDLAKQRN